MRRVLAGLLAAQLALVGVYVAVERSRADSGPFAFEVLDEPAPPGLPIPPEGTVLVHFWATWCAPCVTELPELLAAADDAGIPLLAVTEEDAAAVERFFPGGVPGGVVRDPSGELDGAWRVSGLPDTFVVRDGRVVARMGGPRRWGARKARAALEGWK